jgi:hypothetical protein
MRGIVTYHAGVSTRLDSDVRFQGRQATEAAEKTLMMHYELERTLAQDMATSHCRKDCVPGNRLRPIPSAAFCKRWTA